MILILSLLLLFPGFYACHTPHKGIIMTISAKYLLLILTMLPWSGFGQHLQKMHSTINADTSFNITSEFRKQVKQYPHISIAEADTSELTVYRDLVYGRIKSRKLHLDLFTPGNDLKEPLPVIILIHGGGWRSGDKSMEWPLATALARKGYLTICPEYRLSPEALYPAAVTDISSVIRWIRRHASGYGADPLRIALSGTSAGGQLAALMGSVNDSKKLFHHGKLKRVDGKVQAVVDIDGILAFIHPESGEGADRPGKPSAATLWFGSNAAEKQYLWIQASPLSHVHGGTAPFLFLNSAQPRFHAGREDFISKLDSLGIFNQVHTIPDTPHTFWLFHPWFPEVVDVVTDFLDKVMDK